MVDESGSIDDLNTLDVLVEIVVLMFESFDLEALMDADEEEAIGIVACMVFHAAEMILGKDASLHQFHLSHILGKYCQYSFFL